MTSLNLRWALDAGLLERTFDAELLAYSGGDEFTDGRLHVTGCWQLATNRREARELAAYADGAPGDREVPKVGLTKLELPWAHIQALIDASPTPAALCDCLTDPSEQLPTEISLAHAASQLAQALADPDVDAVDLLLATADVLTDTHRHELTSQYRNQALADAVHDLLATANQRMEMPTPARAVLNRSVWREARFLSTRTARHVNAAFVDLDGHRLLVRAASDLIDNSPLLRQPVLSDDPHADPATL